MKESKSIHSSFCRRVLFRLVHTLLEAFSRCACRFGTFASRQIHQTKFTDFFAKKTRGGVLAALREGHGEDSVRATRRLIHVGGRNRA